jgi:hypothetical protein
LIPPEGRHRGPARTVRWGGKLSALVEILNCVPSRCSAAETLPWAKTAFCE